MALNDPLPPVTPPAIGENPLGVYIAGVYMAGVNNYFNNPTYSIKDSLRVFLSVADNGGVEYMALDNPLPPPLYDSLPTPPVPTNKN